MTATGTMALAALFCCCVGIAGVLWGIEQHRAKLFAECQARRIGQSRELWREVAEIARAEWARSESALHLVLDRRSRAVSAGNRTKAERQQARKAETTQRLERVAARKRGRA